MNHSWERNARASKAAIAQRPGLELNVSKSHFGNEIKRRTPWILLSVLAGFVMIGLGQAYEDVLSQKIQLVFFIPMIVYMSDSIGTETLALFVRELSLRRVNLKHIIVKEMMVGLCLGLISGIPMGLFSYIWLKDGSLALTVTAAMTVNGVIAVFVGMVTPIIFAHFKKDPALGTDEITTAVSDNLSMLVYLVVASLILFGT